MFKEVEAEDPGKQTQSTEAVKHSGFLHLSGLIAMHGAPSHICLLPPRGRAHWL